MSKLEDHIVNMIKPFINKGNVKGLQKIWIEYRDHTEFPRILAWDYIFQEVYLYASIKKQKLICEWLNDIFLEFDPILQSTMQNMVDYAKVLQE